MDIILLESLNKLGKAGEIVTVKDGFAKNYLIPEKKAIIANKKNKTDLENRITQINSNNDKKIVVKYLCVYWIELGKDTSDLKRRAKLIRCYLASREKASHFWSI